MSATRNSVRPQRSPFVIRYLLPVIQIAGLLLALIGYLGAWIAHETVALTVTGLELAEFAKFFPQVQGGVVPITRALFYAPFIAILVLMVFFVSRSVGRFGRWIASLGAAALVLVTLLPYSVIESARHALATGSGFVVDPSYTKQLALLIVGVILTLLAPLARRFSPQLQSILLLILALVGIIPATWQFVVLRPLVITLYDSSLGWGWGLIVCLLGFGSLLLSGVPGISGKQSMHES